MGRIRTIKPEFFTHEGLYELEMESGLPIRLAFAGLFTACDREGRFRWQPRRLKLDILPFDDVDFSRVLNALVTGGYLVRYASGSDEYGVILSWAKHQSPNCRESASKIPAPTQNQLLDASVTRASQVPDATTTRKRRDDDAGTWGTGTGTGTGRGDSLVLSSDIARVEREGEEILNNSSTRAFNGPDSERELLPSDDPRVIDFVAEARRIKALQEAQAEIASCPILVTVEEIPIDELKARYLWPTSGDDEPTTEDHLLGWQAAELIAAESPNLLEHGANSPDSAISRVDKSHSGTESAELSQNRDKEIAQNASENDSCEVDEATPYPDAQTPQEPGKALDGEACKLPRARYSGVEAEVLPPDGSVPDYPRVLSREGWVALALSFMPRSNRGGNAERACAAAIMHEWDSGKYASEHDAARYVVERSRRYREVYDESDGRDCLGYAAARFYDEGIYASPESTWRKHARLTAQDERESSNAGESERAIQQLRQSRGDHHGLPSAGGSAASEADGRAVQSVRPGPVALAGFSHRAGFR